jgi:glutamyl-tRNA synthetase
VLPFLQRAGLVKEVTPEIEARVGRIVETLGDRIKVFGDILLQAGFFFGEEVVFDDKAFTKRVLADGAPERLADYRQWLADRTAFDTATLERETHAWLAEKGVALGDIVHAIRVAVTGSATGPGLFECLELIGKELSLRRIDRALAKARAP